jgi:hypothetical protein
MNENWWPKPLAHLHGMNPWDSSDVVVAEIKSFDDRPHAGHRHSYSALVPIGDIDEVLSVDANLDDEVETSGPFPNFSSSLSYLPSFSIPARGLNGKRFEPLVLSWKSHNRTVLLPDPGFLMTYGLVPRALSDGTVYWDDPQKPIYGVVTVSAPSTWKFPKNSGAVVKIAREYLQDYLSLRHMALVSTYWEQRWCEDDEQLGKILEGRERIELSVRNQKLLIGRAFGDKNSYFCSVWGSALVAKPGPLPISEDSLDSNGLSWPGYSEPVTNDVAKRFSHELVYVLDTVLEAYEGRPEFEVHPESGSVAHGTQWSVGFCSRVERDLIQLELKKLYEGAPSAVIHHWNKFAVSPVPLASYPDALSVRNIATRAKAIVYGVVKLGEALSLLGKSLGIQLEPEHFVGLRRGALDYNGWWKNEVVDPIARHVPLSMTEDAFLERCVNLTNFAVEGLSEKNLRRLLVKIGAQAKDIEEFKTLKLLDRLARLAQIATSSGLSLSAQGKTIDERLKQDKTVSERPLDHLFALYDLRLLKSHKANERSLKLSSELRRFGINVGGSNAGYGLIADRVYDCLGQLFEDLSGLLTQVPK